jgi:phosphonate transport system substrate-binding protein
MALALLLLTGCGSRHSPIQIELSQVETKEEATYYHINDQILRVAVAPVISPQETFNIYGELVNYIGDRLDRPAELVQGKTYAEINDLVRSGDVTVALVCTNGYLEGQEDFGMEALVVPQVQGQTVYYSYLIVPQASPVKSLEELRGKSFAFSDPLSNSGRLVVVYRLQQVGETPESFFERYIFTYSHDNSIRAVAGKMVDGAAVDSLVYDYLAVKDPQLVAKTRIIARWGPYGINPVVVHPRLDSELKESLRQLFLTMHQDPQGQQILQQLIIDKFVLPDDGAYDSVREMRNRVREQE